MIKIILRGLGGELDSRTINPSEDAFEVEVRKAVIDLAYECAMSVGDTISIEEVQG